jgi:hypothetical protein
MLAGERACGSAAPFPSVGHHGWPLLLSSSVQCKQREQGEGKKEDAGEQDLLRLSFLRDGADGHHGRRRYGCCYMA